MFNLIEQSFSRFASVIAQTDVMELAPVAAQGWNWAMLVPVFLAAIGYLLVQEGVLQSRVLLAGGIGIWTIVAGIVASFMPVTLESFILFAFATIAAIGAIAFLTARQPVYAALGFATAVLSTCGVLFMQSALFVAAATMIVYAGATIIVFLFVLMFAQHSQLRVYDINLTNPYLATSIGTIVMVAVIVCVFDPNAIPSRRSDTTRPYSEAAYVATQVRVPTGIEANVASSTNAIPLTTTNTNSTLTADLNAVPSTTAGLGRSMYTDYLAAIELAGAVLLVATIGAIALATRPAPEVNG